MDIPSLEGYKFIPQANISWSRGVKIHVTDFYTSI